MAPPDELAGEGRPEPAPQAPLAATLRQIERSAGALATISVARMEDVLPWFRELPADQRAWVMLVAQAGVRSLVEWLRNNTATSQEFSDEVFDAAPRALARSLNLQQTVALIKVTIDVVEEQVPRLAAPGEEQALREAVLRFSREIAFAAARAYARAAETRGSWDARLQALLVDSLVRASASGPDSGLAYGDPVGFVPAMAGSSQPPLSLKGTLHSSERTLLLWLLTPFAVTLLLFLAARRARRYGRS